MCILCTVYHQAYIYNNLRYGSTSTSTTVKLLPLATLLPLVTRPPDLSGSQLARRGRSAWSIQSKPHSSINEGWKIWIR